MDFQVKLSKQATQDLWDIIEYINDVLFNHDAADQFYNEVNKKLNKISENPFIYPLSRDKQLLAKGYRTAVIGNYLMFYSVDESVKAAYIIRIICGKRDLGAVFSTN